jgi:hypothetical protein
MAEPLPYESALVMRAQRLSAISLAAPLVIFLATVVTFVLYGRPHATNFLVLAACSMVFLIVIAWLGYWGSRDKPVSWRTNAATASYFNVVLFLPTMFKSREDLRFQLDLPAFVVVVAVLTIGIVLASSLPARRAARLVLDDLPSDVVNSSLVIRFKSRVRLSRVNALHVLPDSLKVIWRKANGRAEPTYPLTDVSAIAVRSETRSGEYPLPGIDVGVGTVQVERGEVVVFDLPDGQLVFPAKDAQRLRRFVEDRCRALAGDAMPFASTLSADGSTATTNADASTDKEMP